MSSTFCCHSYRLGLPHFPEYYARCCKVRGNGSTLSQLAVTGSSSPQISLARLPPATVGFTTSMGFVVLGRFARHRSRPPIRFWFIGSRVCSTLPSDPASRRRPCPSLALHPHQVVNRTLPSKRSIMAYQKTRGPLSHPANFPPIRLPRHVPVPP